MPTPPRSFRRRCAPPAGLASAIGRLGAIASPVLVGYLYPKFGFLGVFGTTTVTLVLGALVVLVMGVPHARPLAGSHRGGRGEMSGARPSVPPWRCWP